MVEVSPFSEVDAELIFGTPASEQAVRDRLLVQFPDLSERSLFGAGAISSGDRKSARLFGEVEQAIVFARQY